MAKLIDLKREWGVSMQALIERAWNGKVITAGQRMNFYKSLSARGWRTSEPVSEELAPERPALAQSIASAMVKNGLTVSEIADIVGVVQSESSNPFMPHRSSLHAVNLQEPMRCRNAPPSRSDRSEPSSR